MFLNITSGRGYSHTLLFFLISTLLIFLVTKGNKVISSSYFIGVLIHLLLDLPEVPLFFPFISYEFIYLEDPFGFWIYELFHNPLVYITEISGIIILIFIVLNNKLYNFKKIRGFLLTHSRKEVQIDN